MGNILQWLTKINGIQLTLALLYTSICPINAMTSKHRISCSQRMCGKNLPKIL